MGPSGKNKDSLEGDLQLLLAELCTQWGFCNRLSPQDLLDEQHTITASEFADALLSAEGMNPEHEPKWRRRIRALFTERYGESISLNTYTDQTGH